MKNRFYAFFICLLAALALAACSGGASGSFTDEYNYDDLSQFIKLADYKGIEYTKTPEVTDEDVKAKIDETVAGSTEEEKIESGTVGKDSIVNIDYVGSIDGVEFEGGTAQGQELDIANSNYIEGFAEGIVGHKVGETFDLKVKFPEDYGKEELNGKDAVFKTTINYMIRKKTPKYSDEWVKKNTEYKDKASYEASVKEELEKERAANAENNERSEVFSKIAEASEVTEYPEKELAAKREKLARKYENMAKEAGSSLEDYLKSQGTDTESFNKSLDEAAENLVKTELILRSIAREEGIELTESGYKEFLNGMLEKSGYTEDSFKKEYGTDFSKYAEDNDLYMTYMFNEVMTKVMEYSKAV